MDSRPFTPLAATLRPPLRAHRAGKTVVATLATSAGNGHVTPRNDANRPSTPLHGSWACCYRWRGSRARVNADDGHDLGLGFVPLFRQPLYDYHRWPCASARAVWNTSRMRRAAVGRAAGRRAHLRTRCCCSRRTPRAMAWSAVIHIAIRAALRHVRLHEEHGRERLGGGHRRHHVQLWRHRRDDLSTGDVSGARRLASVAAVGDPSSRATGRWRWVAPASAAIACADPGRRLPDRAARGHGIIAVCPGSGSIPRRGATRSPARSLALLALCALRPRCTVSSAMGHDAPLGSADPATGWAARSIPRRCVPCAPRHRPRNVAGTP